MILVMRHAEKPDDLLDPDLSPPGKARARQLADYIPKEFGAPDTIFAAAVSKHSARPFETVKPLSKRTGVPIDATIADQDYAVLVSDLFSQDEYAGKSIVVCWHHGNIPGLMEALGAAAGQYPNPWNPAVFNVILKVEFPGGAASVAQIVEPF
jgi:hypothetical protein